MTHIKLVFVMALFVAGCGAATPDQPADNHLTAQEKRDGWSLLVDGKSADQWLIGGEPIPAANVHEGAINPHGIGGGRKLYVMYTKQTYGDFTLVCDFKVSPGCNSGIFLRVGDPAEPVQTGLEIQIFDSAAKTKPDKYDCGALYDAQAPSTNAMKPAGEWNHVEITAKGPKLDVVLNGQRVIDADLDQWSTPGKNRDGTKNKFKSALKNFPREGHIGLQDHNHDVWYRNIKVRSLTGST